MKITSDNKQFIFDRIHKIILCFEDGCEVTLDQVTEWDFDLDRCDYSYIDLTNIFVDKELVNRFCTNKERINFIHIEGQGYEFYSASNDVIMIDIQCNMRIRKVRLNGNVEGCSKMYVQLEGTVK